MVETDPTSGARHGAVLRALARYRRERTRIHFGVFCRPEAPAGGADEAQEAIELGLDASIHGERAYKDTSNHGASAGGYARDVANPLKAATKVESQV